MFNVTTHNLSPDLRTAQADVGACDFGELDDAQLISLLEIFREIDPIQNHDAEPHVAIQTSAGKFLVRTGQGKLFLYDARDSTLPYVELDAAAIARELGSRRAVPDASAPEPDAAPPAPHHGIAITILIAGLLLNGYTLYSVFYIDDVNEKPAIALVTDPKELVALQHSVVGRYATGAEPGDRAIDIAADGRVHFFKILASGERPDSNDTYRIGRHDSQLCLATRDSGVIDVTNIETIVYYRDTYRRVR